MPTLILATYSDSRHVDSERKHLRFNIRDGQMTKFFGNEWILWPFGLLNTNPTSVLSNDDVWCWFRSFFEKWRENRISDIFLQNYVKKYCVICLFICFWGCWIQIWTYFRHWRYWFGGFLKKVMFLTKCRQKIHILA